MQTSLVIEVLCALLSFLAAIVSFASYRSTSIGGPEVVNAGRLVKAVVYLMVVAWVMDQVFRGDIEPHAWLILIALLAFAETVQGMARINSQVDAGPWLRARYARRHG